MSDKKPLTIGWAELSSLLKGNLVEKVESVQIERISLPFLYAGRRCNSAANKIARKNGYDYIVSQGYGKICGR